MAKINPIQLQKHLKGVDYPASKQALIEAAEQNGADEDVRAALGELPDEEYQTPADVSQALGRMEGEDGDGGQGDGDRERNQGRQQERRGQEGQDENAEGTGINPI